MIIVLICAPQHLSKKETLNNQIAYIQTSHNQRLLQKYGYHGCQSPYLTDTKGQGLAWALIECTQRWDAKQHLNLEFYDGNTCVIFKKIWILKKPLLMQHQNQGMTGFRDDDLKRLSKNVESISIVRSIMSQYRGSIPKQYCLKDLRQISIVYPWIDLILKGIKKCENRKPTFQYIYPIGSTTDDIHKYNIKYRRCRWCYLGCDKVCTGCTQTIKSKQHKND